MEERKITRSEVIEVLERPEVVKPEREGRYAAWAVVNGRGIKVIYFEKSIQEVWIITVARQSRRLK
jgi:hypothetical protein